MIIRVRVPYSKYHPHNNNYLKCLLLGERVSIRWKIRRFRRGWGDGVLPWPFLMVLPLDTKVWRVRGWFFIMFVLYMFIWYANLKGRTPCCESDRFKHLFWMIYCLFNSVKNSRIHWKIPPIDHSPNPIPKHSTENDSRPPGPAAGWCQGPHRSLTSAFEAARAPDPWSSWHQTGALPPGQDWCFEDRGSFSEGLEDNQIEYRHAASDDIIPEPTLILPY